MTSAAGTTSKVQDPTPEWAESARQVDEYLSKWLDGKSLPSNLDEAIRYSVLGPGKRIRPLLVLHSCAAVGGDPERALAPAAAVEMIHAFSLVHDDLPAMDDDDMRRGRPSLHRHTNEAMAILAGDALMGLAVELVLDRVDDVRLGQALARELVVGCNRMIAGQVYDTEPAAVEELEPIERLQTTHRHKTGALIRASCRMGGLVGGANPDGLEAVSRFGDVIGLMFQVVDDLVDETQTSEHLGKTAGKDRCHQRLTYPALLGLEGTRDEVERLRKEAIEALSGLDNAGALRTMCEFLAVRTK
jgi:geranylgeranyl pyrophosphate synthase